MADKAKDKTTEEELANDQSDQKVEASEQPTGDEASVNYPGGEASPNAERQGEVVADKGADTDVLGGGQVDPDQDAQVKAQNIADAQADAQRNHAREQEENRS